LRGGRRVAVPDAAAAHETDQELGRLQAAVLAKQRRRGRKAAESVGPPDKPQIEAVAVHLTPGKLNAVRAAFEAGIKPSQARQFGLSRADVQWCWRAIHQGNRRLPRHRPRSPWEPPFACLGDREGRSAGGAFEVPRWQRGRYPCPRTWRPWG
jgi:hypothetical protein